MCDTVWSILIIVPASFLHAYPRSPIESQPSPVGGEVQHALDEEWRERPVGMEYSYLSSPTAMSRFPWGAMDDSGAI